MEIFNMEYENWLRGCVYHDGRKGFVYLPCDKVLKLADWIESHRNRVEIVRCKDCKWFGNVGCAIDIKDGTDEPMENDFCSYGERKDDD